MNADLFDQQMGLRRRRQHHGSQGFREFSQPFCDASLTKPQLAETIAISVTVMVLSQLILRVLTRNSK